MTTIHHALRFFNSLSAGALHWSFSCQKSHYVCSSLFLNKYFGRLSVHACFSASTSQTLQTCPNSAERRNAVRQDEQHYRIHILGIGNMGKLLAHSLATAPDRPAIVLMLHRPTLVQAWNEGDQTIELVTDGVSDKQKGYEIEAICGSAEVVESGGPQSPRSDNDGNVISILIIGTKTIHTISALSAIKSRLTQDSTILFTQNGMGTIDEVNAKVFPDSSTRPKYMTAIISHGVFSRGPFSSVHAGFGTINIGRVPQSQSSNTRQLAEENGGQNPALSTTEYLPKLVTQVPVLSAVMISTIELMQIQFEKLIINAMVNPLTVIFDCRNGELFKSFKVLCLMRSLLSEASQVIRLLPELQNIQGVEARFSKARLDEIVLRIVEKTSKNLSSMLQDARAGRETEIDYINGYIVKRGEQLGVDCVYNRTLVRMVKDRNKITDGEVDAFFPYQQSTGSS